MERRLFENAGHIEEIAKALFRQSDFLFLARGIHFPIALEGALKLKEIIVHSRRKDIRRGEMKHGPNALIDESSPVVFLAAYDTEF